jgi:hypothetical protein
VVLLYEKYHTYAEYQNKVTTLVFRKDAKLRMRLLKTNSQLVFLLDENTATFHYCLKFSRFEPKSRIFIKKVNEQLPSGIIQKLEKDGYNIDSVSELTGQVQEGEPEKLTIEHLTLCFAAIMICLALCCAVFLIECLTSFVNNQMNLNR